MPVTMIAWDLLGPYRIRACIYSLACFVVVLNSVHTWFDLVLLRAQALLTWRMRLPLPA
jgi:hypothetical protein